jgi:hypothetical protein
MSSLSDLLGIGGSAGAKAMMRMLDKPALSVASLSEPIARAAEAAGHSPLRAQLTNGRLQLDDACADALCISGLPPVDSAGPVLAECARVVKTGGRILVATAGGLTGRGPDRHLVAALMLHAGLVNLEQQIVRGTVITRARVRR